MSGYDTKNVDSKYEQHTEEKKEGKGRRGTEWRRGEGKAAGKKMIKSNAGIYSVVS